MTGRVFTKLFFSFVVVLFLGMVVLDFSLRQVMEQSLRAQTEEFLVGETRLLAAHINASDPASLDTQSLERIARLGRSRHRRGSRHLRCPGPAGYLLPGQCKCPGRSGLAPEVAAVVDQHQSLGRARRGRTLYVAVPAGPLVVRLAYPSTSVPAAVHVLRRGIVLGFAALAGGGDTAGGMAGAAGRQTPGPHRDLRQPHRGG